MSQQSFRTAVLLEQRRFKEAEQAARKHLADDPDDGFAHAQLAIALSAQGKNKQALAEVQTAVGLSPDEPYCHYVLGVVLAENGELISAADAVREAIRLEPEDPDSFSALASIHMERERWSEALAAAEQGLAIDPENVDCLSVRSNALTHLGRHDDALKTANQALREDPEDAFAHISAAQAHLHAGRRTEALNHFRETLRIDPTMDAARQGILECLKARNVVYRMALHYFLWMSRIGQQARWFWIIGLYVVFRIVKTAGEQYEVLRPLTTPLVVLYVLFFFMTWTAQPLFDLLLRLDHEGRMALDREQIRASNLVGGCVLGFVVALLVYAATAWQSALLSAFSFFVMVIPIAATFQSPEGWPRRFMSIYTSICAVCGLLCVVLFPWSWSLEQGSALRNQLNMILIVPGMIFLLGAFLASWVANLVASADPRRGFTRSLLGFRGTMLLLLIVALPALAIWGAYSNQRQTTEWQACIQQMRARGEPVTLADVEQLRPVVPNEENGALVIEGLAEELARLKPPPNAPVLIFNEQATPDELLEGLKPEAIAASRAFLAQHRDALGELLSLSRYDGGRLSINYEEAEKQILNWVPEALDAWRPANNLLKLEAVVRTSDGDIDAAIEVVSAQLHLAMLLEREPSLAAQLKRLATEMSAIGTLERALASDEMSSESMTHMHRQIEAHLERASITEALWMERALYIEICEQIADGRLKPADAAAKGLTPTSTSAAHAMRLVVAEAYSQLIDASRSLQSLRRLKERFPGKAEKIGLSLGSDGTAAMVTSLLPTVTKVAEFHFLRIAGLCCAKCALAAERYRLDHGTLPTSLDVLVPAYLAQVPVDPFADAPMGFSSDEKGILIYSIALDPGQSSVGEKYESDDPHPLSFRLKPRDRRGLPANG
jgi:tetratricopeptide (TPR) repeat protein